MSNKTTSQQNCNLWQLIAVLDHRKSIEDLIIGCFRHVTEYHNSTTFFIVLMLSVSDVNVPGIKQKTRNFIQQERNITSLLWAAFLSGIDAVMAKH